MHLPVVYEDENLFVIDKPAGIAVHKVSPTDPQETVADVLLKDRPYLAGIGENDLRPGLVHRLDKETSGLLVIAKNQEAFAYLKNLFQTRNIKKTYLTLVHGLVEKERAVIDVPLGKIGTKQTTQLKGRRELTEREAQTEYKALRRFKAYTFLEVSPLTGRTHQIRAHLNSIGHPVVGDTLYGKRGDPLGLRRLFLHATRLSFTTPGGNALTLEAGLPESLQKVLDTLE